MCLFVCYDSQNSDYSLNDIECNENCEATQHFYTLLQKMMSLAQEMSAFFVNITLYRGIITSHNSHHYITQFHVKSNYRSVRRSYVLLRIGVQAFYLTLRLPD